MRLLEHSSDKLDDLLDALLEAKLHYGARFERSYESLLTPTSLLLTPRELQEIARDYHRLVRLYGMANELYQSSLTETDLSWVRRLAEFGLSTHACRVQRHVSNNRLMPTAGRLDYVDLDNDRRWLAEVQWKSGGPGFFLGHHKVFADVYPCDVELPLPDPSLGYLSGLEAGCREAEGVMLNEVREAWLPGEEWLTKLAHGRPHRYVAVGRERVTEELDIRPNRTSWSRSGVEVPVPVRVLRGRGFIDLLDALALNRLQGQVDSGQLWIETPMSSLFHQKWPLALPFTNLLDPALAEELSGCVIPGALLFEHRIEWGTSLMHMDPPLADDLSRVTTLEELVQSPERVRGQVVLKCGSASADMNSRGRGVFRLSGSRSGAIRTAAVIRRRLAASEVWLVQAYRRAPRSTTLVHPKNLRRQEKRDAFLRIMAFGSRSRAGVGWELDGLIANYSTAWKSSGAGLGPPSAALSGSAFADVRRARTS